MFPYVVTVSAGPMRDVPADEISDRVVLNTLRNRDPAPTGLAAMAACRSADGQAIIERLTVDGRRPATASVRNEEPSGHAHCSTPEAH